VGRGEGQLQVVANVLRPGGSIAEGRLPDESGETIAATSSGVANRFNNEDGRTDRKNSFSTVAALVF
jgi:hypothetical protein